MDGILASVGDAGDGCHLDITDGLADFIQCVTAAALDGLKGNRFLFPDAARGIGHQAAGGLFHPLRHRGLKVADAVFHAVYQGLCPVRLCAGVFFSGLCGRLGRLRLLHACRYL